MTTLCNVKKSVSVPECFGEQPKSTTDNIYYEEAWDLRMARLGVDIARLNDEFIEKTYIDDEILPEPPIMTRSCTESSSETIKPTYFINDVNNITEKGKGIISMTSSAIADSVIANNPVYSFKKYSSTDQDKCAHEPQKHIKVKPANLKNQTQKSGLLLNNNCYELTYLQIDNSPSQLVNAIVDNTGKKSSRHKTSSTSSSSSTNNNNKPKNQNICNNLCYNNITGSNPSNFSTLPLYGYSRQISAPVDTNNIYQNRTQDGGLISVGGLSPPEWSTRSLHHSRSTRSHQPSTNLYDVAQNNNNNNINNSNNNVWTGIPSNHSSTNQLDNNSNYIKHLKGQEIARNCMLRHSRRPECHLQRTVNDDGVLLINNNVNLQQMSYMQTNNDRLGIGNGNNNNIGINSNGSMFQQPFTIPNNSNNINHINKGSATASIPRRYNTGFNDSRLDMIADSNRTLEDHLWYHPNLSRTGAEQLLSKYPEGSFLVRPSQSCINDEYSLSIRYKQKWLHMKITRDNDGNYVLGQYSQPYPSIPTMIRHYSCSFLPVKGANLISLTQPIFRH